jgi:Spy/CpxP family protein refolding chaperone
MIIPKLGLAMILTGAAGFAQQPPQPPLPLQSPKMQASPQGPVTEAERRQFDEILARRGRGEMISPEDQRFAREIVARLVQVPASAAPGQAPQREIQLLRSQSQGLAAAQPARSSPPPLERALGVPGGKWWTRPEMAQRLGLADDQIKKMDEIFLQFRLKSIDLNASVQKEETIMEPLVGVDPPDEAKILAQIDKLAQARAELEKTNARMLLGIRRLLTQEQWKKLKGESPIVPIVMPAPASR